jgi:hypothetical protein
MHVESNTYQNLRGEGTGACRAACTLRRPRSGRVGPSTCKGWGRARADATSKSRSQTHKTHALARKLPRKLDDGPGEDQNERVVAQRPNVHRHFLTDRCERPNVARVPVVSFDRVDRVNVCSGEDCLVVHVCVPGESCVMDASFATFVKRLLFWHATVPLCL